MRWAKARAVLAESNLQGQVEQRIEPVGDGVDEQEQAKREQGGAEEACAAEPERGSGTVGEERHAGVQDADARAEEEEQQHGRAEEACTGDAEQEQGEAGAAGNGRPAESVPSGDEAEQAEQREKAPMERSGSLDQRVQAEDQTGSRARLPRATSAQTARMRGGGKVEDEASVCGVPKLKCRGSRPMTACRAPRVLPSCV